MALALKLDAGTLRFDIRTQDLGGIVRGAAEAAETGDHPLEVQTDEQVEAPTDGIHVAFVVRQLLENAAIFSPAGSPISVRLTSEGDSRRPRREMKSAVSSGSSASAGRATDR